MSEKREFTDVEIKEVVTLHEEKAEKMLEDKAETEKTVDKAMELAKKVEDIPFIGKYVSDIFIMCDCVMDYIKGNYKEIPIRSIVTILGAIIYLVSPADIIPDVLPGVGHIDDAGLIAFVLKAVHDDLNDYKAWKKPN